MNNIIGGPCPCQQLNAECDEHQEICYCESHYVPSSDKRRCIESKYFKCLNLAQLKFLLLNFICICSLHLEIVPLNENCEENLQCQQYDLNAICDSASKQCLCQERFIINDGKCVSAIGKY